MAVMDWIRKLTDIIMPPEPIYEDEEDSKATKKAELKAVETKSEPLNQNAESIQPAAQTFQTESKVAGNFAQGYGGGGMGFTRTGGMVSTADSGVTSMGGVRYEAYSSETSVKPSLAVVKTPQLTMKIYKPTTYDDQCRQIADDLLKHNAVIVNFEGVSEIEQQRIGDFVIGAVYMISGKAEMIANKIVLYVPSGIDYEMAALTSSMRRYN